MAKARTPRVAGQLKKNEEKAKRKSAGELAKEAKHKEKTHLKTARGRKISKAMKKYWKKLTRAQRLKRAKKMWITRHKLYGKGKSNARYLRYKRRLYMRTGVNQKTDSLGSARSIARILRKNKKKVARKAKAAAKGKK